MGWLAVALLAVLSFGVDVHAADVKIGVMNIQKVISQSENGQKAQKRFESRVKELQSKFKPEEEALIALRKDIEKKSSAWSEEVKSEKIREYQKMEREFRSKTEDARFEMKQMQDKELEPILKALQTIVEKIGKEGGYTMIVEMRSGLYFDKSIDLSDTIVNRLNATLK
jgi:outer membrane protein